ncbi:MAG: hypothetical protein WCF23_07050 [Candidatus Nitrosopolaris sp.]
MSEKSRLHRTRKEIIYSIKTQQQGRSIPCQGFEIGDVMVFYGRPNGAIENENAGPINLHPPPSPHDFGGKGKYRAPEFIWFQTVAPTALKFLNSTKLGKQYQNDLFVGDYNNGNLYRFKLNQNRTGYFLVAH